MNSYNEQIFQSLTLILRRILLLVIALLPVHALLSVWLTSNFGYAEVWQGWKEGLLAGAVVLSLYLIIKDSQLTHALLKRRINQLIAAYVLLHFLLFLIRGPDLLAAGVGLAVNLRYFAIFLLAQIVVYYFDQRNLQDKLLRIIIIGAAVVAGFGLLQATILPDDILRHVGYGPSTIEPFRTIDENPQLVRINSTMRGPSPMGLYLVVIAALVCGWWFKRPVWLKKWQLGVLSLATLATLFSSYSRGAWLGSATAAGISLYINIAPELKKRLVMAAAVLLAVAGIALSVVWRTDYVQQTVLHRDPQQSDNMDSDDVRFASANNAVRDIIANPIGLGPGTAGPASFYGDQLPRIAENYYLQIGQEVGVIGLGLFLLICWYVIKGLWYRRQETVSVALFASFIGLAAANLFLHGWAQDEISLIWWGLAGASVFSKT